MSLIAIRNQVGRLFQASPPLAYTPKQRWVAEVIWRTDSALGYDPEMCAACVANADREDSFLLSARGDHNEAGGISQWHSIRRLAIKAHTGIDVWTASAADQAKAMELEESASWSAYRHVEADLRAAVGLSAKCRVLINEFEGSGNQARDLARQVPMASYWLSNLGKSAA